MKIDRIKRIGKRIYPKGKDHHLWKGGKYKGPNAYFVYAPTHLQSDCRGYIPEHRLVGEKVLGKFLSPKNIVHHIDRDQFNNHPSNLVICEDQSYHLLLHNRMRAIEGCGDPNKRFCVRCDEWLPLSMFYQHNGFVQAGRCKKCHCSNMRRE